MDFRNEKIGFAVSMVMLIGGCWLASWDPSESAALLIVLATFLGGGITSTLLYERQRRMREVGQRRR